MIFQFLPGKLRGSQGILGVIERNRVSLSSAQIKALNTTPVTLVPAPGANKFVQVIGLAAKVSAGATPYTGANALEVRYTNGSGSKVSGDIAAAAINSSTNRVDTAVAAAVTAVSNAPVVASVPTANPAAGDGTIELDIIYRVISLLGA
jgi:hypothetical protein